MRGVDSVHGVHGGIASSSLEQPVPTFVHEHPPLGEGDSLEQDVTVVCFHLPREAVPSAPSSEVHLFATPSAPSMWPDLFSSARGGITCTVSDLRMSYDGRRGQECVVWNTPVLPHHPPGLACV